MSKHRPQYFVFCVIEDTDFSSTSFAQTFETKTEADEEFKHLSVTEDPDSEIYMIKGVLSKFAKIPGGEDEEIETEDEEEAPPGERPRK